MIFILHILLLMNTLSNVYADEHTCNFIEDKSPNLKLKRHLFCDYDPSVRPMNANKNTTIVGIYFIPKLAEFNDYSNTLDIQSWMYITWKDVLLQWNPEDYSNVDTLWVKSNEIWTPDISIQNADYASGSQIGVPYTNCVLSKGGRIVCVPAIRYSSRCITDYTFWPFDKQNCSFEFSLWSHSNEEIVLSEQKFAVVMDHYGPNAQWKITPTAKMQSSKKSKYMSYEEFPTIVVYFSVERVASQLWPVFVTPTIILAAMTLTTLWLDPAGNERLTIAVINFFCHFKCIGNVHWMVPQSGSLPNILIFYHNSMILAGLTLILTCFLRRMIESETSPPAWISSYVSIILSSKPGQILLLSILDPRASARIDEDADDNSDLVGSQTPKKSTWDYVIVIVGWIAFLSFLFTYLIMMAVFLHVPASKD